MGGTKTGGQAAAKTNKEKYGDDFYAKIAHKAQEQWIINGRKPRGFAVVSKEQLRAAGRKGGTISRRGPGKKFSVDRYKENVKNYAAKSKEQTA